MRAANSVGKALRETLPDPDSCQHSFSPEFQKRIQVLKETARRRETAAKYQKQVFTAAVIPLCCTGLFFTVNPEARAAVSSWFKGIYENTLVCHFSAEFQGNILPECDIGYIPDGYVEDQVFETHTGKTILFSEGRERIPRNLASLYWNRQPFGLCQQVFLPYPCPASLPCSLLNKSKAGILPAKRKDFSSSYSAAKTFGCNDSLPHASFPNQNSQFMISCKYKRKKAQNGRGFQKIIKTSAFQKGRTYLGGERIILILLQ